VSLQWIVLSSTEYSIWPEPVIQTQMFQLTMLFFVPLRSGPLHEPSAVVSAKVAIKELPGGDGHPVARAAGGSEVSTASSSASVVIRMVVNLNCRWWCAPAGYGILETGGLKQCET
jgi:hypothetical protein